MEFLHFSKDLHDLKPPLEPKERIAFSHLFAHVWSRGGKRVWDLQLLTVKYQNVESDILFDHVVADTNPYDYHINRHGFDNKLYPFILLFFPSIPLSTTCQTLFPYNCLPFMLELQCPDIRFLGYFVHYYISTM